MVKIKRDYENKMKMKWFNTIDVGSFGQDLYISEKGEMVFVEYYSFNNQTIVL